MNTPVAVYLPLFVSWWLCVGGFRACRVFVSFRSANPHTAATHFVSQRRVVNSL